MFILPKGSIGEISVILQQSGSRRRRGCRNRSRCRGGNCGRCRGGNCGWCRGGNCGRCRRGNRPWSGDRLGRGNDRAGEIGIDIAEPGGGTGSGGQPDANVSGRNVQREIPFVFLIVSAQLNGLPVG
ncbi:MAG: hypothetical protein IJH79_15825 [Lentisphaeria bacterium]|nr:hypothetical protein [Lentisphaeria bacterium]